jgi:hypothetical protein
MNFNETEVFSLDVVGSQSGEKYFGTFECYKRLTHARQLARDRIIRDLLGPNAKDASPRAQSQAEIVAQLQVSLAKAPDWLKNSRFGLDLIDDNVIGDISDNIDRIQMKAIEEVQKKGDEARAQLSTLSKD